MNTLFLSTLEHIPYGGSERLWVEAAKRIHSKENVQIASYTKHWTPSANHIQELRNTGVQTFEHRSPQKWQKLWTKAKNQLTKNPTDRDLTDCLTGFKPNLAVISAVNNLDLVALKYMEALEVAKIPYAVLLQLANEYFWKTDEKLLKFRTSYQRAKKVFFVSQNNKIVTERQLALRLPNTQVVFNPYNSSGNRVPFPKLNQSGSYKIAMVARYLAIHKGQDLLFEVLNQSKWKERNIEVVLYGEGENEKSLRDLKVMYGLDQVKFGSYHDNIDELWANYHALVLPSRMEGMSLAMIEAMLCGRTVICTDVGGAREIIEDNETGFIAAAPTVRHLDEAMERAWARRTEWEIMGVKARETVQAILPTDPAQAFADELLKLM